MSAQSGLSHLQLQRLVAVHETEAKRSRREHVIVTFGVVLAQKKQSTANEMSLAQSMHAMRKNLAASWRVD